MRAESASIASPAASAASESLLPASLRWAGPLLSAGYFCGMSLHRACLAPKWAPLPTIVIGNITVGGTGKTPMTLYLGERLARLGEKPAVLMRGYKGQASDEAREIQNALKRYSVPIVIGSNRLNSAILARERGCSVALLDDGFQHWRLNRDLDIVLIDASRPFGGGHLLPQGRLREPLSGLARAGAVVITRADSVSAAGLSALKTQLARWAPTASVAVTRHRPAGLKEISGEGRLLPLARLNEGIFSPVCGIGNPRAQRWRERHRDHGQRRGENCRVERERRNAHLGTDCPPGVYQRRRGALGAREEGNLERAVLAEIRVCFLTAVIVFFVLSSLVAVGSNAALFNPQSAIRNGQWAMGLTVQQHVRSGSRRRPGPGGGRAGR